MALLGVQFVITLVVALFLQKLSPYYSFARWIMCSRLYRYLYPTNDNLRMLAGKPITSGKGKRKKYSEKTNGAASQQQRDNVFTVPCNIDIQLQKVAVDELALFSQYKYSDYKWLVDFALCSAIVYVLIEIAALLRPQIFIDEFNVGVVWCMLVIYFALRELLSLTAAYWRSEDGGERAMTISFGFFFLVMALGVLVVDERILDFGLNEGYEHFSTNLEIFYKTMEFSTNRAPSVWAFKIGLAIVSALIGAVLGFPGIRYANMHLDSVYYYSRGNFGRLGVILMNVVFFSPVVVALLWVLPLSQDLLFVKKGDHVEKLMTDDMFVFVRVHLLIVVVLMRMLLVTRQLLQSHLESARQKVDKFKLETGRISNRDLQRTVTRVFYYLSAAALQYVAPLLMMLFLGLLLRSLMYNLEDYTDLSLSPSTESSDEKQQYTKLIRSLLSVKLAKGVASFLCWWTNVTFFMTSCFGVVYFKYLS